MNSSRSFTFSAYAASKESILALMLSVKEDSVERQQLRRDCSSCCCLDSRINKSGALSAALQGLHVGKAFRARIVLLQLCRASDRFMGPECCRFIARIRRHLKCQKWGYAKKHSVLHSVSYSVLCFIQLPMGGIEVFLLLISTYSRRIFRTGIFPVATNVFEYADADSVKASKQSSVESLIQRFIAYL